MNESLAACPRCGLPVIEIKDWGKGGKLYVHSTGIENGFPVQNACHVHASELEQGMRWVHEKRPASPR